MPIHKPRHLLIAGTLSLLVALAAGGGALMLVEGGSYLDGLWLSFSVVSTTGFGEGPTTGAGRAVAMLVFAWAVASYLLLVAAAYAHGQLLADERRRLHVMSRRDVRELARDLPRN